MTTYAIINPGGTIDRQTLAAVECGNGWRCLPVDPQPSWNSDTQSCAQIIPVPAGAASVGWIVADLPLAQALANRLTSLSMQRTRIGGAGRAVGGATYPLDPESVGNLTAKAVRCDLGIRGGETLPPINWKLGPNLYAPAVDAPTFITTAKAIADYVQSMFDHEKALAGQLAAAPDVPSLRAIDITAGWPS